MPSHKQQKIGIYANPSRYREYHRKGSGRMYELENGCNVIAISAEFQLSLIDIEVS